MRSVLPFLTSFLLHVGTLAAAVYWLPRIPLLDIRLASGQARVLEASLPSVEREAAPEVTEVSVEIEVRETKPLPVEHKPPTARERPEVMVETAQEMIAVPPESRAPVAEEDRPEHTPQAKVLPKQATRPPSPVSTVASPASVAVNDPGAKIHVPREVTGNAPPHYPLECLLNGIEGVVMVRVTVAADGRVERATLETTSGNAALDASALAAVVRWRFLPATRGAEPVSYEIIKPVRFTIRKG